MHGSRLVTTSRASWWTFWRTLKSLQPARYVGTAQPANCGAMAEEAKREAEEVRELSCFCGAVKISVKGPPVVGRSFCHCSICRRLSGAPFSANGLWPLESITHHCGELSSFFAVSKHVERCRCSSCGSPVLARTKKWVALPLASFGSSSLLRHDWRPLHHIHYGNRVVDVLDDLPKYTGSVRSPMIGTTGVPFILFRSGTSKGPFFLESDLLRAGGDRCDIVAGIMGKASQVDGLGGGRGVTSKAVSVRRDGERGLAYRFYQVRTSSPFGVDPSHGDCGNMIAGVLDFALRRGLVDGTDEVRVHSDCTGAEFRLRECGAGVRVTLPRPAGRTLGRGLLPTGAVRDTVLGVEVTCIDCGRPLVIVSAADAGLEGVAIESIEESRFEDKDLCAKLEKIRLGAAFLMGMGDVTSENVSPKLCLVAPCRSPNEDVAVRYFVSPATREPHPTLAQTAAQALASAALVEGSVVQSAASTESQSRWHTALAVGDEVEVRFRHGRGVLRSWITAGEDGPTSIERCEYELTVRALAEGIAFGRGASKSDDTEQEQESP